MLLYAAAMLGRLTGPPLSVTASPGAINDTRSGAGSLTTVADVASGAGGTSPYTYAWTYVSGDSYTINSPAAASTTFTTTLTAGQLKSGTYRVTVTDAVPNTATANYVIEMQAI